MKNNFYCFTLFFLIISSRLISSQVECPDGMISYWKLDEFGSVNIFLDSNGGHNGFTTDLTRPSEDSGIVNQARNFNGSDEINVADHNDFDWSANTSFSIELWIKTTSPGTGVKVFIGKRRGGNTQMTWWLGYRDDNTAVFFVRDSGGVFSEAVGSKIINDGEWHHIAGVRDDSMKVIQLFVDGVEEAKVSTFFTGDFSGTGLLFIGHYESEYQFTGLIDEVAVYSSRLDADKIAQHYEAGMQQLGYCDEFTTDVKSNSGTPVKYFLSQNYPNPFNPSTIITFSIPKEGNVKLNVYNILGEHIAALVNNFLPAGIHEKEFISNDLTSGIYFYELQVNGYIEVKKMMMMK